MLKKYINILIIFISFTNIYAGEVPEKILELQKNETLLVDLIYDHRDYAIELWNNSKNTENPKTSIEQSIAALEYALEVSNLLFKVQDQLIKYYTEYDPNLNNLNTVKNNKKISENIITEVNSLKVKFIDYKTKTFK